MSHKMMSRMETVSSSITLKKYTEILSKSLKVFYKKGKFELLAELCDYLLSLKDMFFHDLNFTAEFYICGFLVNSKLNNYEKAYVFFRFISKSLLEVNHNLKLKKAFEKKIGHFSENEIIVLCFTTIHILFANFKSYSSKSRAFFQKFRDQFEHKNMMKYANHLASIIYIYSGSLEQSKFYIEKNYKRKEDNKLYDLMLGFCYLMESTNRLNPNKLATMEKAFDFFKKYEINRSKEGGICSEKLENGSSEEAYYNIARAFSHVNCPEMAIKMLQKGRRMTEAKIIESNRRFVEDFKKEMEVETVTSDMLTQEDFEVKKETEETLKKAGLYYNNAFNEMMWYKFNGNKKMEKYMIENFLTFDEF